MKSIQTMYLCVCMFAEVVCIPVCACTHTYTHESIHTSLFRIVIIELHMCTAKCSVRGSETWADWLSKGSISNALFGLGCGTKISMDSWVWTNDLSFCNSELFNCMRWICESQKPAVPRDYWSTESLGWADRVPGLSWQGAWVELTGCLGWVDRVPGLSWQGSWVELPELWPLSYSYQTTDSFLVACSISAIVSIFVSS